MKIEDATIDEHIAEMYNSKDIVKNQNKNKITMVDDHFNLLTKP